MMIVRYLVPKGHALSSLKIKHLPATVFDRLSHVERKEWTTLNKLLKVETFRFSVRFDDICG
jgi:hypothetical protein